MPGSQGAAGVRCTPGAAPPIHAAHGSPGDGGSRVYSGRRSPQADSGCRHRRAIRWVGRAGSAKSQGERCSRDLHISHTAVVCGTSSSLSSFRVVVFLLLLLVVMLLGLAL